MKWLTVLSALILVSIGCATSSAVLQPATTSEGVERRTLRVDMVVLEQTIMNNRLGAKIPNGQIYALARDVVPIDHPMSANGHDLPGKTKALQAGHVRLATYKRPRPITLRANVGDTLEIHFTNLLPPNPPDSQVPQALSTAGVQIMGLDWASDSNNKRLEPGESHVYRYVAEAEGVFMMYSPNGSSIPASQLDYGLFGAVNVQPKEAEWYRSQVTAADLKLANYRVSADFLKHYAYANGSEICNRYLPSDKTGLPADVKLRRKTVVVNSRPVCPDGSSNPQWEMRTASAAATTEKVSTVVIDADGYLKTLNNQPLINYQAMYPRDHVRAGSPVLNMLVHDSKTDTYALAHSDLTAIITGPQAGRFPYYLDSPSFIENPATPDRRQPYREFTIAYHISPNTAQAFDAFNPPSPLSYTLAAGEDAFAVNYGIAGIAPEIYANRIGVGPMGINKDEVDLLFEEFFLSAWSVGDPAILVDTPANNALGQRASKALYPDDPSNVYHSYMRDHVKFRVMNAGSVAPHVHHQHAHQWLHTPNSADGHYLDSQMINPGSTYTLEMTYNGSGNRNQTVGDSIFHCHIYPHFAQGMWGMWRVHDVFETGTKLDKDGRPAAGARALPDGEIQRGTPIPGLVPLPTLGMAPMPAPVKLVNNGRQVEVIPSHRDKNGEPVYENPGFPFFIPGIAGHRAPHPPMDFAWKEDDQQKPLLHTEQSVRSRPFRKPGDRHYLDGGLPRHVVLGGTIESEFHTRWDFSKTIDTLLAMELPEEGTAVERAAMAAHATRNHPSYLPDGLPGNFVLNGLPPAPGAPYAAPEVDDYGNSTFNERRYKAAVVQTDVVFNKEGWHYPQQRFITLLEDVKPTMDGEKPPEPFFFRANTGETIEFWHTNLVPNYYQLDDFQVRTPTDILGQHIHLVKFDVTSSDGAGNGFNYEDGTFSPDEVRERIDAINRTGGLYHFDGRTQRRSNRQTRLQVTPYRDDYGNVLGKPPADQNWDGAQTTIQRFDTDPLLNHQGQDRTLRTVFTHDHFGPSTHQQVGLYGAMLVEPAGSNWFDAVTGEPLYASDRSDGGPTSWQALIETNDSVESYREFAMAMGDLQLAYKSTSRTRPARPSSVWFSEANKNYQKDLDNQRVPAGLREAFRQQGAILGDKVKVTVNTPGQAWTVVRNKVDNFALTLNGANIDVRTGSMVPGWADSDNAIWPPSNAGGGLQPPYPTVISDPGGSGNIGTWVANYRNEPLDARIQGNTGKNQVVLPNATDAAYGYSSIQRYNERLNRQPKGGSPIAGAEHKGDGFTYPKKPLLPEGPDGVQGTDPYTPMLRAYPNDNIEVRAIVGAVDSVHSFHVQGVNWDAEPSYSDSGRRDTQGMGISEHYEMLFTLPPADGSKSVVDSMYSPSASTMGLAKGAWGIMRTYPEKVATLASLSNNPMDAEGPQASDRTFFQSPSDATVRRFDVVASLNRHKTCLQYKVKGHKQADCEQTCTVTKGLPLLCGPDPDALCSPKNGAASCTNPAQSITQVNACRASASLDTQSGGPGCQLGFTPSPLILRAAAGDWLRVKLHNNIDPQAAAQLTTHWGNNQSGNTSSPEIDNYAVSASAGINPLLVSYDRRNNSGLNVGRNAPSTVPPGQSKTFTWYAGNIATGENGEPKPVPMEFGGVNLIPADPLLQQSYGLYGALIVEPAGSTWARSEAHTLQARILDTAGKLLFNEIVVLGQVAGNIDAVAGSEVRLRVLNPNASTPGQVGNNTHLIVVEGHGWPEEPFAEGATVIANNPVTQWMGTQQVTPRESYNLLLPMAGGEDKVPGTYAFYYYPTGPVPPLGTLTVTPER